MSKALRKSLAARTGSPYSRKDSATRVSKAASFGPRIAEVKEYLGGLTIVAAPDLDAALEWGRKAARATTLTIEVRPFDWA